MVLQKDGVTDPPGIKLRPIETIHGIMYLDPGAITNALSYVFGPLVETLWVCFNYNFTFYLFINLPFFCRILVIQMLIFVLLL